MGRKMGRSAAQKGIKRDAEVQALEDVIRVTFMPGFWPNSPRPQSRPNLFAKRRAPAPQAAFTSCSISAST